MSKRLLHAIWITVFLLCQSIGLLGQSADLSRDVGSYNLLINQCREAAMQGDLGQARLCCERALRIAPQGQEAHNNIAYIKDQMSEEVLAVKPFFLYRAWQGIAGCLSPNAWMVVQLLMLVLAVLGGYFFFLRKQKRAKWLLLGSLVLSGLALLLGFSRKSALQDTSAAVVMQAAALKSGADDRADDAGKLHPGYKVIVLDSIGDWYKVSLMDKEHGWVKKGSLTQI